MEPNEPNNAPAESGPSVDVGLSEHYADHLKESSVPLFLLATLCRTLPHVNLVAYKLYRDRNLAFVETRPIPWRSS